MNINAIDWDARERAIRHEVERLRIARERPAARWKHTFERIGMRSIRVVCGLAFLAFGVWLIVGAPSISDAPFAALTLGAIAKTSAHWLFGVWFCWSAFPTAFGDRPTSQEIEEKLTSEAATNVDTLARSLGGRYS